MQTLSCGMWDQVPWPGIKPRPPVLGDQSPCHWTTREVPVSDVFRVIKYWSSWSLSHSSFQYTNFLACDVLGLEHFSLLFTWPTPTYLSNFNLRAQIRSKRSPSYTMSYTISKHSVLFRITWLNFKYVVLVHWFSLMPLFSKYFWAVSVCLFHLPGTWLNKNSANICWVNERNSIQNDGPIVNIVKVLCNIMYKMKPAERFLWFKCSFCETQCTENSLFLTFSLLLLFGFMFGCYPRS